MRAIAVLIFLALAGSATAAVVGIGGGAPGAQASAIAASGSFSFVNSRDSMPIFSATEIAPGDSVSGTVEITDTGTEPGELALAQHDLTDTPGPGGAKLSERLSLRVTDITAPAHPVTVYAGPLAPMSPQPAGLLEPDESRTYEFVATLPAAGSGGDSQNEVQGASASVAYSWTASEPKPVASPEPTPTPAPSGQASAGSPSAPAGSAPTPSPSLQLAITRVRRVIRRGRLLVSARCNNACRIGARGRIVARSAGDHRGAKLHLSPKGGYSAGTQQLRIHIPGKLRRWLLAHPGHVRLSAHLALIARDPAGNQAAVRRALRVRAVTGSTSRRGSGRER